MNVPLPYQARLEALRRKMVQAEVPALLVLRPENRRYLSGYTAADPQQDESAGALFITPRRQYVLTDHRYQVQAAREARGYEVRLFKAGPAQSVARLARRHRIARLGYEDDHLSVKEYRALARALKGVSLKSASGLVEELRQCKDPGEVRRITRALRITEAALARTLRFLRPGRTEMEVAHFLEEAMIELGAEGPAFESIVASGPNAALPHAVPSRRRIREGETIIFDCGARYKGYGADLSRTIVLGRPRPWIKPVYALVRQAQLTAIRGLRPGLRTDQADALARKVIEAAGFGPHFGHALGHGVGLATHEPPSLSRTNPTRLAPGAVVTVEPGVYLEGRGGVRLEEMVLIRSDGVRVLNRDRTFYPWLAA